MILTKFVTVPIRFPLCSLLAVNRRTRLLLILAGLLLPLVRPCLAQLETGEIVGTVTDASGAAFPGAQVIVQNILTGAKTSLTSGAAGTFDAPVLPPGDYKLTASAAGFKTLVAENINVHVGSRRSVDFKLEPGTVQESINVSSSAIPLIDTAKSDTGDTVTSEKVNNVPLADHSNANLLRLAPGVVNCGVLSANAGSSNYFQSAIRIELDGTDASQVDSDFVGPSYNSGQRLDRGSVDAIQELQIETGNYGASMASQMAPSSTWSPSPARTNFTATPLSTSATTYSMLRPITSVTPTLRFTSTSSAAASAARS